MEIILPPNAIVEPVKPLIGKIILSLNLSTYFLVFSSNSILSATETKIALLDTSWSFKGIFGKFDRGELRRGYQVYSEVCSSCHSISELRYRNLSEKGGPEFSVDVVKKIAASFEITDGPNSDGEMFTRPGRLSDKFAKPYPNIQAATAANGGAYPPDMSVLVKARKGGAAYIYSLLQGYEEPPEGFQLDDGVYYNKFMSGNQIKMPNILSDDLVEYADGTKATVEQMSKDISSFLAWVSEPSLEARHKMGFRVILYLVVLAGLVYLSMNRLWSRIESKK